MDVMVGWKCRGLVERGIKSQRLIKLFQCTHSRTIYSANKMQNDVESM